MQKRCIGQTGIQVSVIGLGTVKFGRNQGVHYPQTFSLPKDDEIKNLLDQAQQLGINLLDTAPAYGESETRLGNLLSNRDQWVISTKAGEAFTNGQSHFDFSVAAIQKSVECSLKRLQTDYLDILLIHSNGEDLRLIEQEHVFVQLEKLKQSGKIRAYGMSTKTIAGGLKTVTEADLAMVTYNPTSVADVEVIRHAQQNNKGIFIKKALASGHLNKLANENPIAHALNFIFSEPGVTSVIVGTLNPQHLQQNVASALSAILSRNRQN